MPPAVAPPATAAGLLALVRPFSPAVEGGELVFAADLPPDLERVVAILHTGLRALLTGRRWWATTCATPAGPSRFSRVGVVELDPAAPLPPDAVLLCVEGDRCWDRLRHDARERCPDLFATG